MVTQQAYLMKVMDMKWQTLITPIQHFNTFCQNLNLSSSQFLSQIIEQRLLFRAAKGWIKSTCACKHMKEIHTNMSKCY